MVEVSAVAWAVAGLLARKAGEGLAGEAGKGAWAGMGRLAGLVRRRLAGDATAEEALQGLQTHEDAVRVRAVAEAVEQHAQDDERFRQALEMLVAQACRDRSVAGIVAQAFDHARQVNIAGDLHGDVRL